MATGATSVLYRLPHARGGVSNGASSTNCTTESSPRPWGCFLYMASAMALSSVFPTPVGVFPRHFHCAYFRSCLPHARGGVSLRKIYITVSTPSSPRTWGCFSAVPVDGQGLAVFPTPVGVFLMLTLTVRNCHSLPHARGGVSSSASTPQFWAVSSPRPWGCFLQGDVPHGLHHVFPTPVGVFLHMGGGLSGGNSLPHARGGVSYEKQKEFAQNGSSPRPWGCFCRAWGYESAEAVFPTPVGVFLRPWRPVRQPSSLPHARGGVSAYDQDRKSTRLKSRHIQKSGMPSSA